MKEFSKNMNLFNFCSFFLTFCIVLKKQKKYVT